MRRARHPDWPTGGGRHLLPWDGTADSCCSSCGAAGLAGAAQSTLKEGGDVRHSGFNSNIIGIKGPPRLKVCLYIYNCITNLIPLFLILLSEEIHEIMIYFCLNKKMAAFWVKMICSL